MNNVIKIRQLTKRFGSTKAVDALDLQIPKGSIYAFLGPNGAGKTTTIKTMMNLISPSFGEIEIMGKKSTRLGEEDFCKIGYVSENQKLPEWMTVKKFLKYCQSFYPQWDEEFCNRLVEQFDLPMNSKLSKLSRGVKMKAALTSSLAYRPELLVLDEPFSGLDALVRQEFINGILELTQSENWTIFISSHDIDEVERLADRVGMINKGKLQLDEETESLQRRFKRVGITLSSPIDPLSEIPKGWMGFQAEGRAVTFVDSLYEKGTSEQEYQRILKNIDSTSVMGVTLKDIFINLAKQYKILNI